jgi:mycothiol synthase
MTHNPDQVQMIWPEGKPAPDLHHSPPPGVRLRAYRPGDEPGFFALMEAAGWPDWDDEKLGPWLYRILPEGWFMLVDQHSGEIIGTSMATHDHTWPQPFCGEVGWTAVHPRRQGERLGAIVVATVVERFQQASYTCIHLYTEVWRLAALKMYLKLGFIPFLDPPDSSVQWGEICNQIGWPFDPNKWKRPSS